MAYSVTEYGDSVDWDDQYDKFRDAVRQSRSQSRTKQSQSSDSEDSEGEEEKEEEEETIKSIPTSRSLSTTAQHQTRQLPKVTMKQQNLQPQQRAGNDFEGDVFDAYEYSSGNCPDAGSLGVPCAPDNLPQICNKYDRTNGSFRDCLAACEPAFCCIHDADREMNYLAPNCNTDENCGAYSMCYIAWWKLHDTIGRKFLLFSLAFILQNPTKTLTYSVHLHTTSHDPYTAALFLRIVQDDEFYDITADEIADLQNDNPLFIQVLLHHWDDIDRIIAEGTEDGEFNADNIFLDPEYWESDF